MGGRADAYKNRSRKQNNQNPDRKQALKDKARHLRNGVDNSKYVYK